MYIFSFQFPLPATTDTTSIQPSLPTHLLHVVDLIVLAFEVPCDLPLPPIHAVQVVTLLGRLLYHASLHVDTGEGDPLIHTTVHWVGWRTSK